MTILNYIDGNLVRAEGGATLENMEPALGKPYGTLPDSSQSDVDLAVQAAKKAFPFWSGLSVGDRSAHLLAISKGIEARFDELAEAESRDTGKPLALAKRMDITRAKENISFFATAILHDQDQAYHTRAGVINYTRRKPLGVVGCISPWNLPLYLFTWKIAPALAAGCTVVAKPSELSPATAFIFSQICIEAGLPKGVLNIVHGKGEVTGAAIVQHPDTKAISFTGGSDTGRLIAGTASRKFKKISLEMGGKNPAILFEDADLELAADGITKAAFTNQGEICLCGSRIHIQASVYDQFKGMLLERVRKLKVGNPKDPSTDIGALIHESHYQKVTEAIETAKEEGGRVLCGGVPVDVPDMHGGYFLMPTLIEGLSMACKTNQEEIFGPVSTLLPFEDEAEAIAQANGTGYGLSASIWTRDLARAHRTAEAVDAGVVWINTWLLRDLRTPFGGMKDSGIGREGGFEALHFFTEEKNICLTY